MCELTVETNSMLKYHLRTIHMVYISVLIQTDDKEIDVKEIQTDTFEFTSDDSVQTEEEKTDQPFVKYPCNYCGTNIANDYHLMEHIGKCCGTLNMYTEPGLPKPPFSLRFLPPPSFYNPYHF